MKKPGSVRLLGVTVMASGAFDVFGAVYFALLVGTGKSVADPPAHPFYAQLIASFLLCLGLLQIFTALDIRRRLGNLSFVILSRLLYGVLFFGYFLSEPGFPSVFLPTAIADLIWSLSYVLLIAMSRDLSLRSLLAPEKPKPAF